MGEATQVHACDWHTGALSRVGGESKAASDERSFQVPVRWWMAISAAIALFATIASVQIADGWGLQALRAQSDAALTASANLLAQDLSQHLQRRLESMGRTARLAQSEGLLDDPVLRRRWLDWIAAKTPGLVWVGLAAPDGTVLDSAGGTLIGSVVADRRWLASGLQRPSLLGVREARPDVLPPEANGQPQRLIDVATPIRDASGTAVSVLGMHVTWRWVTTLLTTLAGPLREDGISAVSIRDRNGEVLERIVFEPANAQAGVAGGITAVTVPIPGGVAERDLGWRLSVEQRTTLLDGPSAGFTHGMTLIAAGIGLAALVLTGFAGFWVQRRLAAARQWVFAIARLVPGTVFELQRSPDGAWRGEVLAADGTGPLGWCAGDRVDTRSVLAALQENERAAIGAAVEAAARAARRTDARPTETTICLPDAAGTERWVRIFFRARQDLRRGVVVEAIAIDETALKRAEAEAHRAKRVAELGLLLEEDHRAMAEQRAASADLLARQRSDILAMMAHEIRTPLNGLIGFAELLAHGRLDDEQHAQAKTVLQSGQRLLGVVNDVLDLAKMEAGKVGIETISFSPREAMQRCLALHERIAAEKGLALSLDIGVEVPAWVAGDPARFAQIMGNLLSNALKFTDRGSVAVRARMASQETGRLRLRVEVQDTGIGIADTAQARLFTMFEQAHQGTTRRHGGTGLGLAICRKLAEAMKGEVGLQSTRGKGSMFWFELPFGTANAPATVRDSIVGKPARNLAILVADDTIANRALMRAYLADAGHEIVMADDGVAAVAAASQRRFDLILMDVNMPRMDGLEASRRIRAAGPNAATVILAVTAAASATDRLGVLEAGMDGHVSKPVGRAALLAAIAAFTGGDDPASSRSAPVPGPAT